jgi:hypothetical protein
LQVQGFSRRVGVRPVFELGFVVVGLNFLTLSPLAQEKTSRFSGSLK